MKIHLENNTQKKEKGMRHQHVFSPKLFSYNPSHQLFQNYTLDEMKTMVFKCIIS
jgi:hypothetical protein